MRALSRTEFWDGSLELALFEYGQSLLPVFDELADRHLQGPEVSYEFEVRPDGTVIDFSMVDSVDEKSAEGELQRGCKKLPSLPPGFNRPMRFRLLLGPLRIQVSSLLPQYERGVFGSLVMLPMELGGRRERIEAEIEIYVDKPFAVRMQCVEGQLTSDLEEAILSKLSEAPNHEFWPYLPESVRFLTLWRTNANGRIALVSKIFDEPSPPPPEYQRLHSRRQREETRREELRELHAQPNSSAKFLHLGLSLRDEKDYVQAQKYLVQALEIDPLFVDAHRELAYTLSLATPQEQFAEIAPQVISHYAAANLTQERSPQRNHHLQMLARAFAAIGQYKAVVEINELLSEINRPYHHLCAGKLLKIAGDPDSAIKEFNLGITFGNDQSAEQMALLYFELSETLAEVGRNCEHARKQFEKWNARAMEFPWYQDPSV
jgi:tetratricopeptide (TPR) repeat protein